MNELINIREFIDSQIGGDFPLATENFAKLDSCLRREMTIAGNKMILLYNPERKRSVAAKTDKASIAARRCFLCRDNLPERQGAIEVDGYQIRMNPYPITRDHLTIVLSDHEQQLIRGRLDDMAKFAARLEGFTVFYNGPVSGASAPDHFHFQAVPTDELPLWENLAKDLATLKPGGWKVTFSQPSVIAAKLPEDGSTKMLDRLIEKLPLKKDDDEPRFNILMRRNGGNTEAVIIPRKCHRASTFTADPESTDGFCLAPACVEMAGVIIAVREIDFERLTPKDYQRILSEVCYTPSELIKLLGR